MNNGRAEVSPLSRYLSSLTLPATHLGFNVEHQYSSYAKCLQSAGEEARPRPRPRRPPPPHPPPLGAPGRASLHPLPPSLSIPERRVSPRESHSPATPAALQPRRGKTRLKTHSSVLEKLCFPIVRFRVKGFVLPSVPCRKLKSAQGAAPFTVVEGGHGALLVDQLWVKFASNEISRRNYTLPQKFFLTSRSLLSGTLKCDKLKCIFVHLLALLRNVKQHFFSLYVCLLRPTVKHTNR